MEAEKILGGGQSLYCAALLVCNARCLALARPGVLSLISRVVGSHVRTSLDMSEIFAPVFPACTTDTPTYWLRSAKNNAHCSFEIDSATVYDIEAKFFSQS